MVSRAEPRACPERSEGLPARSHAIAGRAGPAPTNRDDAPFRFISRAHGPIGIGPCHDARSTPPRTNQPMPPSDTTGAHIGRPYDHSPTRVQSAPFRVILVTGALVPGPMMGHALPIP